MAVAPLCQNFPSCGKRHYGACGSAQTPRAERPAGPKKKSKSTEPSVRITSVRRLGDEPGPLNVQDATIMALLERVESLEARVLELESRKKYMRDYQRDRRAKEKGDG